MEPGIIYENSDFLAINKPAGMLVHGIRKAQNANRKVHILPLASYLSLPTVVDWLLINRSEVRNVGYDPAERPGIVHRLDRDTSGVLLVAKNQKTFLWLKKMFQEHEIKKIYLALVRGVIQKKGIIDMPIGLRQGSVKHDARTVFHRAGAKALRMIKNATTEYIPIKVFGEKNDAYTLLHLIPKTGRTHQLRVHMASIGYPIVGDPLYGAQENPWRLKRQFLHAESVEFNLADGKRIKIEADPPDELQNIIKKLYSPK